jgi:hypothetical protein
MKQPDKHGGWRRGLAALPALSAAFLPRFT